MAGLLTGQDHYDLGAIEKTGERIDEKYESGIQRAEDGRQTTEGRRQKEQMVEEDRKIWLLLVGFG